MIPHLIPTALTAPAKALYRRAVQDFSHQADVAERDMTAAVEIARARLGRLYTDEHCATLHVITLARHFTVARDEDPDQNSLYAEVEVLTSPTDREGHLLAALVGATFHRTDTSSSPWPTWRLSVRHATATDSDHSSSYLADLTVASPVLTDVGGASTTTAAILTDARLYPLGADPTLIDERDWTLRQEPQMCEGTRCGRGGLHPIAPFTPPEREDLAHLRGVMVRITTTPLPMVDANGLPLDDSTSTRTQD